MFSGWRMIDELNKHWSGTSTGKRKAARARITWRDTILIKKCSERHKPARWHFTT